MTTIEMNALLKEFAEYKRIKEETEKQLKALQAIITAELNKLPDKSFTGTEHTANITVFWKNRFDQKALKESEPALYNIYTKQVQESRFNFK